MKPRVKIYAIPIFVWLLFSALFVRNYLVDKEYERRLVLSAVGEEARLVGRRFETFFRERTADLTFIVRSLVDQEGARSAFETNSRRLHHNHPSYKAIAWIDEDKQIQWVVPGEDNERFAGTSAADYPALGVALAAADSSNATSVSQVWVTDHSGHVIALVLPVSTPEPGNGKELRGYVVGLLRVQPIVQAALASEDSLSFLFGLSDAGRSFLKPSQEALATARTAYSVTLPLQIADRTWELCVMPTDRYLRASTTPAKHIGALATGILASSVLSFVLGLFLHRRHQLLAALREKRETEVLHAKVANNTFEGIAISCQGILRYVNPAFLKMFGYERADELVGQPVLKLVAPEEHERIRTYLEKRARGASVPAQYSFVGLRKDGSRFHVETIVSTLELQGEMQTLGFYRDVDERMQAEEKLRLYKRLFRNAGEGIIVTDCDGVIQEVNPAFARMTGYRESECLGQPLSTFRPDPSATVPMSEILSRVLEQGSYAGEASYRRKDGTQFPVLNSFDAIRDDHGEVTHVLGLCMDLTERKSLEAQLLQAQKMESIGTLAGGIAHDFNNLLTGILGYSSFLLATLPTDAQGKAEIQAIEKTALRAADLTKRLLAFSRKAPVDFQPLNLNEVVQDTVHFLRRSMPKEIEVDVHCDPELPTVEADLGQMQQVLLNLCVNARDAMPKGGRLVIETQHVDIDSGSAHQRPRGRAGRFVVISVTDTGVGIPRRETKRIFEPFYTTKEVGKGTGLGLAMVYGIVESHHGWVDVFSEVGVGTTFKVFLPAAEARTDKDEATAPLVEQGDETILVVDDEPVILELAASLLEWHGYTVLTASDGEGALRVLSDRADEIHLVILDLVMPRMSGEELFGKIRELYPELKVLLSSGWTPDSSDLDLLRERGAMGFVQKPYQVYQLGRAVRQALDDEIVLARSA
jgi:PAS domain S-box-containing protein